MSLSSSKSPSESSAAGSGAGASPSAPPPAPSATLQAKIDATNTQLTDQVASAISLTNAISGLRGSAGLAPTALSPGSNGGLLTNLHALLALHPPPAAAPAAGLPSAPVAAPVAPPASAPELALLSSLLSARGGDYLTPPAGDPHATATAPGDASAFLPTPFAPGQDAATMMRATAPSVLAPGATGLAASLAVPSVASLPPAAVPGAAAWVAAPAAGLAAVPSVASLPPAALPPAALQGAISEKQRLIQHLAAAYGMGAGAIGPTSLLAPSATAAALRPAMALPGLGGLPVAPVAATNGFHLLAAGVAPAALAPGLAGLAPATLSAALPATAAAALSAALPAYATAGLPPAALALAPGLAAAGLDLAALAGLAGMAPLAASGALGGAGRGPSAVASPASPAGAAPSPEAPAAEDDGDADRKKRKGGPKKRGPKKRRRSSGGADEEDTLVKSREGRWIVRYNELLEFRREHGHCRVPHGYAPNRKLSWWVMNQRAQYAHRREGKKTWLSDDRIRLLTDMGFVWTPHEKKGKSRSNAARGKAKKGEKVETEEEESEEEFCGDRDDVEEGKKAEQKTDEEMSESS